MPTIIKSRGCHLPESIWIQKVTVNDVMGMLGMMKMWMLRISTITHQVFTVRNFVLISWVHKTKADTRSGAAVMNLC